LAHEKGPEQPREKNGAIGDQEREICWEVAKGKLGRNQQENEGCHTGKGKVDTGASPKEMKPPGPKLEINRVNKAIRGGRM